MLPDSLSSVSFTDCLINRRCCSTSISSCTPSNASSYVNATLAYSFVCESNRWAEGRFASVGRSQSNFQCVLEEQTCSFVNSGNSPPVSRGSAQTKQTSERLNVDLVWIWGDVSKTLELHGYFQLPGFFGVFTLLCKTMFFIYKCGFFCLHGKQM